MKRAILGFTCLLLALESEIRVTAAGSSQDVVKETTHCCVILQVRQQPGGKGFHLWIRGSQGFYQLYQRGPEGYGLARNRQIGNDRPQTTELGGFQVIPELGAWHVIVFEMKGQKIRVYFDGRVALEAEDPDPLPVSAAVLKVFAPGSKPAEPQPGDPAAPEYSVIFHGCD